MSRRHFAALAAVIVAAFGAGVAVPTLVGSAPTWDGCREYQRYEVVDGGVPATLELSDSRTANACLGVLASTTTTTTAPTTTSTPTTVATSTTTAPAATTSTAPATTTTVATTTSQPAFPPGQHVTTTAQLLAAAAAPGATVYVAPGTYPLGWDTGWLRPASGVTITAEDPARPPVLDCGNEHGGAIVQLAAVRNVALDHLVLRCTNTDGTRTQPADNTWSDWMPAAISATDSTGIRIANVWIDGTGNGLFASSTVADLTAVDVVATNVGWYSNSKGRETGYALYVQGPGAMTFTNWAVSGGHSWAAHVYGGETVCNGAKVFDHWTVRGPLGIFTGGGNCHMTGMVFRGLDVQVGGQPLVLAYGWVGCSGCSVTDSTLSATTPGEPVIRIANDPSQSTITAYPGDPTGGTISGVRWHGGQLLDRSPWAGMTVTGNTQV